VHETVQVPRRLLDLLAHLVVAVEVEDVGHEVEGILVVLNLGVQPSKIEAIGQVLFVDLAEVLVPPRRNELARVSLDGDSGMQGPGTGAGGGRTQSRQ
jgi:hypothetical protein